MGNSEVILSGSQTSGLLVVGLWVLCLGGRELSLLVSRSDSYWSMCFSAMRSQEASVGHFEAARRHRVTLVVVPKDLGECPGESFRIVWWNDITGSCCFHVLGKHPSRRGDNWLPEGECTRKNATVALCTSLRTVRKCEHLCTPEEVFDLSVRYEMVVYFKIVRMCFDHTSTLCRDRTITGDDGRHIRDRSSDVRYRFDECIDPLRWDQITEKQDRVLFRLDVEIGVIPKDRVKLHAGSR